MTATKRPETLARQRANELIRAWDGRSRSINVWMKEGTALIRLTVTDKYPLSQRESLEEISRINLELLSRRELD